MSSSFVFDFSAFQDLHSSVVAISGTENIGGLFVGRGGGKTMDGLISSLAIKGGQGGGNVKSGP